MTRGLLLIDQQMNTVIIPFDDPDLEEFFRYKPGYPNNIDKAHQHRTRKALNEDVRAYLDGKYEG